MRDSRTATPLTCGFASRALAALTPSTQAILRIGTGVLFMQHGAQKLFGWLGGFGGAPGATAPLFSLMGVAGVLEFFGGLLVVLGCLTRPVGLLLAGEMVAAYVIAHLPRGGWPIQNGGELALLYALVFLFLVGNGPWSLSVDGLLRGARAGREVQDRGRREPWSSGNPSAESRAAEPAASRIAGTEHRGSGHVD